MTTGIIRRKILKLEELPANLHKFSENKDEIYQGGSKATTKDHYRSLDPRRNVRDKGKLSLGEHKIFDRLDKQGRYYRNR